MGTTIEEQEMLTKMYESGIGGLQPRAKAGTSEFPAEAKSIPYEEPGIAGLKKLFSGLTKLPPTVYYGGTDILSAPYRALERRQRLSGDHTVEGLNEWYGKPDSVVDQFQPGEFEWFPGLRRFNEENSDKIDAYWGDTHYKPEGFGNKFRHGLGEYADVMAIGATGLGRQVARNLANRKLAAELAPLKVKYPAPYSDYRPPIAYPEERIPFLQDPLESKLQLAAGKKMSPKQIREYLTKQQNQESQLGYGYGSVKASVMVESGMDDVLKALPSQDKIDPSTLLRDPRYTADHIYPVPDIKASTDWVDDTYGKSVTTSQYTVGDPDLIADPWVRTIGIAKEHPQYQLVPARQAHEMYPNQIRERSTFYGDPSARVSTKTLAWSRGADHTVVNPKTGRYESMTGIQEMQSDVIQDWKKVRRDANAKAKAEFNSFYDAVSKTTPDFLKNSPYLKQLTKMRKQDSGSVNPEMWNILATESPEKVWGFNIGSKVRKQDLVRERYRAEFLEQAHQHKNLVEAAELSKETGIDLYSSLLGKKANNFTSERSGDIILDELDGETVQRLHPTEYRYVDVPNEPIGTSVSNAQEALARNRDVVDRAINSHLSPDTRKTWIAEANGDTYTEFGPYRQIGGAHHIVKEYRKKAWEQFKKTHDMRKFRRKERIGHDLWFDEGPYERVFKFENEMDEFIADNWDKIYKDAVVARELYKSAIAARIAATNRYPAIELLKKNTLSDAVKANDPQHKPMAANRIYSEMLAHAMQRGMAKGERGLVWPDAEDKAAVSAYGGTGPVYGPKGAIRKAANQKIQEMSGQPPSRKAPPPIRDVVVRENLEPIIPDGFDYEPPEFQQFHYMEYTPEMIEHAKKYGIPLSSVGAAVPLSEEQVIVTGAGAPSSTAHEYGHGLSHTLGKLPYEEQLHEVAPEGYPAWATDPKQRERIDQIRRDKGLSSEQRDEIESDIWAGLREGFPRGASAVLRAPLALGDMVYELGDAALANVYGGTPEERSFTNFELPMFTAAEPYADAVTGVNRGFEPITPEGQVGLATGEAMMELGTLNAPLFLGVEKLPALGRQVLRPPAKVKARVNPTFDPSRRDLLKSTAIAGGALATGIGVSKLAKHADEMVHGTKGGRATAKAVTAPKWNTATQAIYDVDRSVARGGMDAVNRGLPPGFDAGSLDFGVMDARPRHLDWLHAPKTPPKGLPGRVEIHRFNYLYDIEKLPGGKKFANQLRQLHEQQARLIKQHGSDWHKTPDGKKHLDKLDELEGKVSGGLLNKVKEAEIARTRPHTRRLIKRRQELERRAQQMENDAYEEARVYHQQERQWEDPSYESYDYIDQQAVDTKWELLNENPEWKIVSDEMMQTPSQDSLIKYDPNTIAYREKRMQAMAAKHGDELWEAERERLVSDIRLKEGFYQSHVDKMAKSKANARDRAAEEARRDNYTKLIREAERDLARHMGLNPEATKTTSQDILNQIK